MVFLLVWCGHVSRCSETHPKLDAGMRNGYYIVDMNSPPPQIGITAANSLG
jgi:hypothetical protein